MKPVVAYRHKLSWRVWRAWSFALHAMARAAPLVLAGLCGVLALAACVALFLREEIRHGHVLATGTLTRTGGATAVALVKLSDSGKVVRLESPLLTGCQKGDRIKIRETRFVHRGGHTRLRARPAGGCSRPFR